MYIYISKIIPFLLMPLSLLVAGIAISLALYRLGKQRLATFCLVVSLLMISLASMPWVANSIFGALEQEFPPTALSAVPEHKCAVVLGGSVATSVIPADRIQLGDSADRMFVAAQLYKLGKIETLVIAAGNHPWSRPGPIEGQMIASLFELWGVQRSQIIVDGNSRNTRENAVNAKMLLEAHGCKSPLMVTSAFHMKRALASFAALGVNAYPVSADFRVAERQRLRVGDFLPSAQALSMTSDALREYMGLAVYKLRGWN